VGSRGSSEYGFAINPLRRSADYYRRRRFFLNLIYIIVNQIYGKIADKYVVSHRKRFKNPMSGSWWTQDKILLVHDTLRSAIMAADTWIKTFTRIPIANLHRYTKSRFRPATEAQLRFLEKRYQKITRGMTLGQASDLITRIVYGAAGNSKREGVLQRKRERKLSKQKIV
jgi:hypothetical protein